MIARGTFFGLEITEAAFQGQDVPCRRTKHADNDWEVTQLCAQEFKALLL